MTEYRKLRRNDPYHTALRTSRLKTVFWIGMIFILFIVGFSNQGIVRIITGAGIYLIVILFNRLTGDTPRYTSFEKMNEEYWSGIDYNDEHLHTPKEIHIPKKLIKFIWNMLLFISLNTAAYLKFGHDFKVCVFVSGLILIIKTAKWFKRHV